MPTPKSDEPPVQRIAKLLARAGIASRREIERMIADGRVAKDGIAIDTPATVLASLDGVTVDGNPVEAPESTRLFLFHKPSGVLTAERDFSGRPTIYDRLPKDLPRLVPVGRLDLNTEGLLLMTTDGEFKRQLELPSTGVERAYRARAYGQVTQAQLEDLMHGVEIEGIRYGSINANIERRTGANIWIEMILTEGKNREVRRVLEHLGLRVSRLIRTRYGPFVLGDLPAGAIGEVRQGDLAAFQQTLRGGARLSGQQVIPVRAEPVEARPAIVRRAPSASSGHPPRVAGSHSRSGQVATSSARKGSKAPQSAKRSAAPVQAGPARSGGPASIRTQGQKPPETPRKPEPAHGREERDELSTRPPRLERAEATPRPPKPVRKAGWAKAKPKIGAHSKPRKPRP